MASIKENLLCDSTFVLNHKIAALKASTSPSSLLKLDVLTPQDSQKGYSTIVLVKIISSFFCKPEPRHIAGAKPSISISQRVRYRVDKFFTNSGAFFMGHYCELERFSDSFPSKFIFN